MTKTRHKYVALVEGEIDGIAFYNEFKYLKAAERVTREVKGARMLDLENPEHGWRHWDERAGCFKAST